MITTTAETLKHTWAEKSASHRLSVTDVSMADDTLRFVITGVSHPFLNVLRRAVLGEVPCMAIDGAAFTENDSSVCDQLLAHRLGQIPLRRKDGKPWSATSRQATFSMSKVGPCVVTSGDIIFERGSGVECIDQDIPIVELGAQKTLTTHGYTKIGVGSTHAKYSSTCGTAYGEWRGEGAVPEGSVTSEAFDFFVESNGANGSAKQLLMCGVAAVTSRLEGLYTDVKTVGSTDTGDR